MKKMKKKMKNIKKFGVQFPLIKNENLMKIKGMIYIFNGKEIVKQEITAKVILEREMLLKDFEFYDYIAVGKCPICSAKATWEIVLKDEKPPKGCRTYNECPHLREIDYGTQEKLGLDDEEVEKFNRGILYAFETKEEFGKRANLDIKWVRKTWFYIDKNQGFNSPSKTKEENMKKKYYHPEGIFKNGKFYCKMCGIELGEELFSEVPCTYPTSSISNLGELNFEIQVWNLTPRLLVYQGDYKRKYYKVIADEKVKEKLHNLMVESIYEAGGALNFSGVYPLSNKLERYIEKMYNEGRIKFEEI